MSAPEKPLIVIDASEARRPLLPRDFWRFRELLAQMTLGAFRAKYLHLKSSFFWYYARPLTVTLVFVMLKAGSGVDLGAGAPYPLFVLTGVCFWFLFADTLTAAAGALARDAGLIQKVYFPILILPLAQTLARLADVGLALLAIAGLQVALGVSVDWELLMLIPVVVQVMLLSLGLGCAVAAWSLAVPDVREGVNIALYLGLFLSPVFFAPSAMQPLARTLLHVNPLVGSLEGARGALFSTAPFPWAAWSYSCAMTGVFLLLGLTLLSRASRNAAEHL